MYLAFFLLYLQMDLDSELIFQLAAEEKDKKQKNW